MDSGSSAAEVVPVDSMAIASAKPPLSYSVHLFEAFAAVCAKGKNGVQTCQAMSVFLQDRANFEVLYSKQLGKIQQSTKSEDWAKQVATVWAIVHKSMAAISAEHSEFSNKHTTSIVAGIKACTLQQDTQIQRLMSEGLKIKARYNEYVAKCSKAKERYDKKCADAIELLQSLARKPAPDDKADLFSKVWDTTKNLAFTSTERQKQRVASALEDVVSAEKAYVRSVEVLKAQRSMYERSLQDNLGAFEVTEEQRLEYIKDLLLRNEKARLSMLKKVDGVIADMQASMQSIDVLDDIEEGMVQALGLHTPEIAADSAWLVDTETSRLGDLVGGVQSMSDQGVICTHAMVNTLVEYISAEETYVQALDKLAALHAAPDAAAANIFSSPYPVVINEGTTFAAAWAAVVAQLQRVSYLHREFGSLLAEPVLLSLGTMKNEYDETKVALDADLGRVYGALVAERQAHARLAGRRDIKLKELEALQVLKGADDDKDDVLRHLGLSDSPSERERKLGWKVDQLRDEARDLHAQVEASAAELQAKADGFRHELQSVLSGYVKNEKYRLDVKKSSLRSLVKAHEHLVAGLRHASQAVVADVERLSAVADIQQFIREAQASVSEPPVSDDTSPVLTQSPVLLEQLQRHASARPKLVATVSSSSLARPVDETEDSSASDADALDAKKDELKEDKDSLLFAMGTADFQRVFSLPASEQVVVTFSCALYLNNFPCQGRMYLSQTHLCFTGWRDAYVVLPLVDITLLERKNTAIVVPNALEISTTSQGKLFFASFLYRDECFQSIAQLRQIQQQMQAILTPDGPGPPSDTPSTAVTLDLAEQEAILTSDYDVVMDETLPLPMAFAYKDLWEPVGYLAALLQASGETLVHVGDWDAGAAYTAFKREERFHKTRTVTYTHNKKYMVGPSAIPTVQVQRVLYDADVAFVLSVTATVSDAPYHDYFRAESRWLFTPLPDGACRLRTGVRLFWTKSTWLKKQIEGATASESKETMKLWATKAVETYQKTSPVAADKPPPAPTVNLLPASPMPVARPLTPRWALDDATWRAVVIAIAVVLFLGLWRLAALAQESVRLQTEQLALLRQMHAVVANFEPPTPSRWPLA
ncbi:hypothetical protein ACHHYP_00933 [Achlya hypogyna]|uniref:VASt domain-containing protein n=1 Tax=Achlya hypogyna TaxID=1202772 RepID=A0A1V9Z9Z3_ACHHY|nr:hypothetical protein ACHHYP_00933 [Achlya hypogyna]